jgi:sulfonate transport system substrate-binding protein
MTNALVKALRYIATHSAADIAAILPDDVTGKDRSTYIDALQHSLPSFSKDGIISEAGVSNAIVVNKAIGAIKSDAQINVSALYTNDFVLNVK